MIDTIILLILAVLAGMVLGSMITIYFFDDDCEDNGCGFCDDKEYCGDPVCETCHPYVS